MQDANLEYVQLRTKAHHVRKFCGQAYVKTPLKHVIKLQEILVTPDYKLVLCFSIVRTLHRTAVFADGSTPTSVREETGPKSGAMLDSLIQGLIYEQQTGNYLQVFIQKLGNKVLHSTTWMQILNVFSQMYYRKLKWYFHRFLLSDSSSFLFVSDMDELPCLLEISSRI